MELLLNLLWVAIAIAAFFALWRKRGTTAGLPNVPYSKALLALAFVLVLLFPFVSVSDDLHPTQAVLEDATKRMQQAVAPYQQVHTSQFAPLLPAMLAISMVFALVALQLWRPIDCEAQVMDRERPVLFGRPPPSFL